MYSNGKCVPHSVGLVQLNGEVPVGQFPVGNVSGNREILPGGNILPGVEVQNNPLQSGFAAAENAPYRGNKFGGRNGNGEVEIVENSIVISRVRGGEGSVLLQMLPLCLQALKFFLVKCIGCLPAFPELLAAVLGASTGERNQIGNKCHKEHRAPFCLPPLFESVSYQGYPLKPSISHVEFAAYCFIS